MKVWSLRVGVGLDVVLEVIVRLPDGVVDGVSVGVIVGLDVMVCSGVKEHVTDHGIRNILNVPHLKLKLEYELQILCTVIYCMKQCC